jgi:hypothetical protein
MREEDAEKVLERNGLGWSLSAGDSFGWTDFFPLTNGCSLGLRGHFRRPFRTEFLSITLPGTLSLANIHSRCATAESFNPQ